MSKAKYILEQSEIRTYLKNESCIFRKNNDKFGGLSNMATQFPVSINNIKINTVEALYQSCRFPHLPELQRRIISQTSPMHVKMISNSSKNLSREDWDNVRVKVMKWCLSVKLAQNFIQFGTILNETGLLNIVESSASDNFWGAIPETDGITLVGKNALGRLLMELRQKYYSSNRYSMLLVDTLDIDNFNLYGEKIGPIDARNSFIKTLQKFWDDNLNNGSQGNLFEDIS